MHSSRALLHPVFTDIICLVIFAPVQTLFMMASYQIQPPENFTFTKPEEWPKWIKRFERFRIVSGLNKKDETIQVNTLVYAMGNEAEDIFHSFGLGEEDAKKYEKVSDKFQEHFCVAQNRHL